MEGYIEKLEEERKKIHVFARELPLCLDLVTQAIETCKKQQMAAQSQCSEQTTSDDGPVLEEFIPIKKNLSTDDNVENEDDHDDEHMSHESEDNDEKKENLSKKSDWLRSVQLWNQTPDPCNKQHSPKKVSVVEVKSNGGGAFHPFKKEKVRDLPLAATLSIPVVATAVSSTGDSAGCTGGGGGSMKKDDKDAKRKSRRCWSPEMHRRFLDALQQLGGSHAATPKQIRELMKVDGLTNDEVKSHLQKYRLYTRRPTPLPVQNNDNIQLPQFLVVGGMWVPPPEYKVTTTAVSGEASEVSVPNTIYAPLASLPLPQNQQNKKSKRFHSEERGCCSSSPTSSSTHTSPASPAC